MIFKVNSDVVFESFEDETVLINLENGNYYSVNGVGSDIWSLLREGFELKKIIQEIKSKYHSSQNEIEDSVRQFISDLCKEGLIVPFEENSQKQKSQNKKINSESPLKAEDLPFDSPKLNKYTDMQELLLLDPIHDVDETGWPTKKNDDSPNDK